MDSSLESQVELTEAYISDEWPMEIFLLIGLPGSGKTTYAKKLRERFTTLHFEYDALTDSFTKDARSILADKVIADIYQHLTSPNQPKYALIDDNFYYKSMLQPFVAFAREHAVPLRELHFNTPLPTCLERNASRPSETQISEGTIKQMHDRIESGDINSRYFSSTDPDYFLSDDFLNTVVSPPDKSIAKVSEAQTATDSFDQNLRKAVALILKENPQLRSKAKEIANFKKSLQKDGPVVNESVNNVEDLKALILNKFS